LWQPIPRSRPLFCPILLTGRASGRQNLIVGYDNLDAVVASHQHTILGSAELGDAHRQPYADGEQGDRERERGDVGQHPPPVVVGLFRDSLVARQVVGDLEPANEWRLVAALGKG